MALTERQRQCFIHATGGQIENARLECYERARQAKTLQGEMYWWSAVFHQYTGVWSTDNMAANLVREMIMDERERNNVRYLNRIDDIVYNVDEKTEQEIKFLDKRDDTESTVVVQVDDPQMHEQQSHTLIMFSLLVQELINICDDSELRALAYFLYKTDLDKYLDYIPPQKTERLSAILEELYEVTANGTIDKYEFIGKTRWFSDKIEKKFKDKLTSILPRGCE